MNSDWKGAKYYQAGYSGAVLGHKALGSTQLTSSKDSIQQGLNGLF